MTYNLANTLDQERFRLKAVQLLNKGAAVDLTEKTFRSPSQNRYLHAILGVVALETGNTVEYVKSEYFKKLVNPAVFIQHKEDKYVGDVAVLRSSRDLTVEEMRIAIDRFQRWAAENGIYIPQPEDEARIREIEIEMARAAKWI